MPQSSNSTNGYNNDGRTTCSLTCGVQENNIIYTSGTQRIVPPNIICSPLDKVGAV